MELLVLIFTVALSVATWALYRLCDHLGKSA